jgi:hypothetical protein
MNIHHDTMTAISIFLCEVVPNATKSCKASLNHKLEKSNPSIPMDYQLIAVDAVDRGLLDKSKINRRQVVGTIEQYHKEKLKSRPLPLECMDQVSLEAVLAESMRFEREFVPDFAATHEEQHRTNFWKAAAKNKFCSVNTTAVLMDPDWLSFFASLKKK